MTSEYIKYKKVKIQSSERYDYAGWFPYDKHIYKMKYSKKIDIYLLKDSGEPLKIKIVKLQKYCSYILRDLSYSE